MAESHNPEMEILMEQVSKAQKATNGMAQKFLENQLKYDAVFDENMEEALKKNMESICQVKNSVLVNKQAIIGLELKCNGIIGNMNITGESVEELLSKTNFEQELETIVQDLQKNSVYAPNNDEAVKNLNRFLNENQPLNGQNDEIDDFEMIENDFTIPIDPISRTEINIPVKNKICHHLYDKEHFFNLFKNNRLSKSIKCPFAGCSNRKVTEEDVEEDSRLRIMIEKARE